MRQVEIRLQKRDSKAEAGSRDRKQNQGRVGEEKGGGMTWLDRINTGTSLPLQGAPNAGVFEQHLGKAPALTGIMGGGGFHQKQNRSWHLRPATAGLRGADLAPSLAFFFPATLPTVKHPRSSAKALLSLHPHTKKPSHPAEPPRTGRALLLPQCQDPQLLIAPFLNRARNPQVWWAQAELPQR